MRRVLTQFSLLLSVALSVSCASAIPPARMGDYVSSGHPPGNEAFTRINQGQLQAALVMVSDTAAPGASLNLSEEALFRLGAGLQRGIGRAIPVVITEIISTDRIKPQPHGDWT